MRNDVFAIKELRHILLGLGLVCFAGSSQATFFTYTTQSGFTGATIAAGTDTFDSLAAGDLPSSIARVAGPYAYTVSSPSGLFGIDGADRWLSNFDRREGISFTGFANSVRAIGGTFFGTNDSGVVLTDQMIRFTVTDTSLAQFSTVLAINSASSFFGVASTTPILSLLISVDPSNLLAAYPTVNNLLVAAVPEPSTYALMLLGLAAIGRAASRRSKR
jgi:hypothetical protein